MNWRWKNQAAVAEDVWASPVAAERAKERGLQAAETWRSRRPRTFPSQPCKSNSCSLKAALLLAFLAFLAASCSSPQAESAAASKTGPVWPPPPDTPRVTYVRSISGPADIGQRPPVLKRVANFITGVSSAKGGLIKPFGLALDERGNLCITDTGNSAVYYCDMGRHEWRQWTAAGDVHFQSPVAVARRSGCFYVADSELGKLVAFTEDGHQRWVVSSPLQRPAGLAISGDSLFVADTQAHTIFKFDLQGKFLSQFGSRGTGPGEFNFPTHVAADPQGRILVTDSLNSRVQVFDSGGKFLSQIGSAGDTSGHFGRPKGVAADSLGHIYVTDAVFDNIQVFDSEGRLLLSLGQSGAAPGEFGLPAGIAISADNHIYVADSYNRRIQVLAYTGEP
jgi:sugar lactone lactonase YvrE